MRILSRHYSHMKIQFKEKIMEKVTQIVDSINAAGFDGAVAIATEAEVQAGAACGQMCLVTESLEQA